MTDIQSLGRGGVSFQAATKEGGLRQQLAKFSGGLYILPSLAILTVMVLIPIAMSLYYSFSNYSVLGTPTPNGVDNYVNLLKDSAYRSALGHTAVYTLLTVPMQTIIALIVANALARRFRNRLGGFIRSALFIPVMSSMVLVGTVWRFLLSTDEGAINGFIGFFGIDAVNWLGQPRTALISVAIATVWKNVGYFLVIYYAGIMDIPAEYYEASSLDGANGWQQFRHITLPSLRDVTFLIITLGTIWSFQVFDLVYTMTGGGPGGATVTMVMAIYQTGFQNFNMGYASAMAIVLFLVVLFISIVQRFLLNAKK